MKALSHLFGMAALASATIVNTRGAANPARSKLPKAAIDDKPVYENWAEEIPNGQIVVAQDGSVLIFKGYTTDPTEPNYLAVKRSEDGGKTWSKEKKVGDTVKVDGDMSDDGRYPNNNRTHLGNVTVDETTADIMVFMSSLKGAQKLYRSKDGGKTWPYNKLVKSGPGNYPWMAVGRPGTPSENMVYVLAGKDWCARFNLAWLFSDSEDRPTVEK